MREAITIRHSTRADGSAIHRLAALDDRAAPQGDALLAFVDGDLRVAVSLNGGGVVADPFHLTDELVELLRLRAIQERRGRPQATPAPRWGFPSWREAPGRA